MANEPMSADQPIERARSPSHLALTLTTMDAIRVSKVVFSPYLDNTPQYPTKVENVSCTKNATTLVGTIHLTAHHLIFRYDDEAEKEMWASPMHRYPSIRLFNTARRSRIR
jgi:hypothetical protein